MKHHLIIISIILLMSCTPIPDSPELFSYKEISFECPIGWSITENETDEEFARVLCEKDGLSIGLFYVNRYDKASGVEEIVDILVNTSQTAYKEKGIVERYGPEELFEFGPYKGIARKSTTELVGTNFKGVTAAIACQNSVVSLRLLGAEDDYAENIKGFNEMMKTFNCS